MWRDEQPYAAIRSYVTMHERGSDLPGLHAEVAAWLSARGLERAGAPFFKFNVVDMDRWETELAFLLAD
jgi:hypothetical protein